MIFIGNLSTFIFLYKKIIFSNPAEHFFFLLKIIIYKKFSKSKKIKILSKKSKNYTIMIFLGI
jgi:hypothetical protein